GAVHIDKSPVNATNAFEVNVTGGTGLAGLFSGASISVPGSGTNSERFGKGAISSGDSSTVIGNGASDASFDNITVVGAGSIVSADFATIVGQNSVCGFNSVAIGASTASGSSSVSVGANITNSKANTVGVGQGSLTLSNRSIAIG